MDFEELATMIEKHRKRVSGSKYVEAQRELSGELYPLLSTILETMDGRLQEVEAQVIGLIEQSLSVVQPELATQIIGTMHIARSLADAVEAGADTSQIVPALREALKLTEEAVLEATVGEEEEEEEEEEGEGEEETQEEAPAETKPGETEKK